MGTMVIGNLKCIGNALELARRQVGQGVLDARCTEVLGSVHPLDEPGSEGGWDVFLGWRTF